MDHDTNGPSLRHEAGLCLAEKMDEMDSHFLMTDLGLMNPPRVQGHNWFTGDLPVVPLPKPWPSNEARERTVDLGGRRMPARSPAASRPLSPRRSRSRSASWTAIRSPGADLRSSSCRFSFGRQAPSLPGSSRLMTDPGGPEPRPTARAVRLMPLAARRLLRNALPLLLIGLVGILTALPLGCWRTAAS